MTDEVLSALTGRWWDWEVSDFDGWSLRMIAGNDLTYHHAVEVVFSGVAYLACPTQFSHPEFRAPTELEVEHIVRALGGDVSDVSVFAWDTDEGAPCVVVAEAVSVTEGHVQHDDPS